MKAAAYALVACAVVMVAVTMHRTIERINIRRDLAERKRKQPSLDMRYSEDERRSLSSLRVYDGRFKELNRQDRIGGQQPLIVHFNHDDDTYEVLNNQWDSDHE
jgi:hypothetical protein